MFRYKKGAFVDRGISVKFPENFGVGVNIEDFESVVNYEGRLAAFNPEDNYVIEWQIVPGCKSTETELRELISYEEGFVRITDIEPFTHNNLKGHQAVYQSPSGIQQYFERRYDLGEDNQLVFIIFTRSDIKAILQKPEIQELLDGIKPEA